MRTRRHLRLAAAGAQAALLAACSTPATRVVLLPQSDDRPSAIVVRTKGGEQTLDKPYQRATAVQDAAGAPEVDAADPEQLHKANPALFELLPARPQRYTVYFDAGGMVLTEASQQTMREMLAAALARTGADVVVTGHTDTVGSGPLNDDLSLRRAEEVRQLLVQRGFPARRIEAVGRGERELAVPTADEVDEPRNRRVTIEVR